MGGTGGFDLEAHTNLESNWGQGLRPAALEA